MKAVFHGFELIGICEDDFVVTDEFDDKLEQYLLSIGMSRIDKFISHNATEDESVYTYRLWCGSVVSILIKEIKINNLACELGLFDKEREAV